MPKMITKERICEAVSKSLIEFGYPDASPSMIGEVYDAFVQGKRFPDLPHDIVGGFAERQFSDLEERIGRLPTP